MHKLRIFLAALPVIADQTAIAMQETLRTLLFTITLIVFVGSYLSLLSRAFKRDALWGVFAVFAVPFGGWLHGFTTWYENNRLMLVNLCAGAAAFGVFFFFPRIPVTGFWTNDSGEIVLDLQPDGTVRNYGLDADCKYSFRPARVITKDMPFTSPLRLKFQETNDFGVGYYDPKAATLDLYELSKDPVYITNSSRPTIALKRVPAPTDAAFLAKLEHMASRKEVADRAVFWQMPPNNNRSPTCSPPSRKLASSATSHSHAPRTNQAILSIRFT